MEASIFARCTEMTIVRGPKDPQTMEAGATEEKGHKSPRGREGGEERETAETAVDTTDGRWFSSQYSFFVTI